MSQNTIISLVVFTCGAVVMSLKFWGAGSWLQISAVLSSYGEASLVFSLRDFRRDITLAAGLPISIPLQESSAL